MDFTEVASYPSLLEAEIAGHTLDAAGVAFQIKGETGHQFDVSANYQLMVPSGRVEEVRELMKGVLDEAED